MNKLAADAYQFGCESASGLFFKEAGPKYERILAGLNKARTSVVPPRTIRDPNAPGPMFNRTQEGMDRARMNYVNPTITDPRGKRPAGLRTLDELREGFKRNAPMPSSPPPPLQTKRASLGLLPAGLGGALGAIKASKSEDNPGETFEGGLRGAAGVLSGQMIGVPVGGILGAAAGALIGRAAGGGDIGTILGTAGGVGLGMIGGGIYGGHKGYQHLTEKYDN